MTFPFYAAGKYVRNGEWLDHETLARMPISNRNSLQDKGYIYPVPKAAVAAMGLQAPAPAEATERFVISRGFGRFDIIEGRVMNKKPLTKEAAHKLAGLPSKEKE